MREGDEDAADGNGGDAAAATAAAGSRRGGGGGPGGAAAAAAADRGGAAGAETGDGGDGGDGNGSGGAGGGAGGGRAEVYTYESASLVYAMNWSVRADKRYRLAVASFKEDASNSVEVIQLDEERGALVADPKLAFRHAYPPTRLQFIPDRAGARPDLLATSGDHLRLWLIGDEGVTLDRLLANTKQRQYSAPLTSFDWNDVDPRRLATSSIDTTVTVWDVERGMVDTQLIAHDREVYDVAWGGAGVFATASADGSVRVFDLRDKDHSTIIFEGPGDAALLRLGWNRQDPRLVAAVVADSPKVVVLDIRFPSAPVAQLARHRAPVNALAWAPHSASHICTAGDDMQALIWDLSPLAAQQQQQQQADDGGAADGGAAAPGAGAAAAGGGGAGAGAGGQDGAAGAVRPSHSGSSSGLGNGSSGLDPVLAYAGRAEINQLQWSAAQPDWVAVSFANQTQILRV